ncbi:MAG TPA: four helix bundle protein [Flavisolibacter sp.]|nr:four helix bundle protein [Flavisolibacter sp.]
MRNFKELRIWQKGIEIAVKTFRLTDSFPKEDKFGICQQMTKAGVSIPSNITEGSSRNSEKDYARFIKVSLSSNFELETQLIIAEQLQKGNQKLLQELKMELLDHQRMLTGFQQKLNTTTINS